MNRRKLLASAAALAACAPAANGQAPPLFPMRRGINLGNALEAPNEGDWGYRIEGGDLRAIQQAGFDGVRLPVRWDQHMDAQGRVDSRFMFRVEEVASWALDLDLIVQLDVHHYATMIEAPARERARFLGLWRQIATTFSQAPPSLIFELLNEPHGARWDGPLLTELQTEAIDLVRENNSERLIVLGPGNWQNIDALDNWRPPDAANIAVSVHYYEPHAFTHQDAEWLDEPPHFGRAWGDGADARTVYTHIRRAADWARARAVPLQLGEFGVNRAVPVAQRAAWTRAVRQACEAHDIGWCVWDFAGAFPVWNREANAWLSPMRAALLAQ